MENASKALIIAGAILLSILIIGLGMTVFNNANSAMGGANLDSQELQSHNSQFLSFQGKQKGTQVIALFNAIKSNNAQYGDRMIGINVSKNSNPATTDVKGSSDADVDADINTTYNHGIKNTTTYYVSFGYGDNGCINKCEVHVYSDDDLTRSTTLEAAPTTP